MIWGTVNGRSWAPEIKGEHRVNAIDYADEDYVWAVGEGGSILHSNEGGHLQLVGGARKFTWAPQCISFEFTEKGNIKDCDEFYITENLHGLDVVDREHVWAVGDNGTIIKSVPFTAVDEETGENFLSNRWEVLDSGTTVTLRGVAFIDVNIGYAIGDNGTILRTSDSGSSWGNVASGSDADLYSIEVVTPTVIVAVGTDGTVARSEDGGITWTASQLTYVDESGETVSYSGKLHQVVFTPEGDRGYVGGTPMAVIRTTDMGRSWENLPLLERDIDDATGERVRVTDRPITGVSIGMTGTDGVRMFISSWRSYWRWGALGGNLGESFLGTRTVMQEIGRTLGPTMQLGIMTTVLSTIVAVPLGIFSAIRQDTIGDYSGRFLAILGLAVPTFWLGTMVLVIPAILWDWAPPMQYVFFFNDPIDNLKFFLIPTAVAGLFGSAWVMRMTRSMMLEVLRQDYIRTAWSKGLKERLVIWRHAVKNAMIPIVTIIGMQVPLTLGGQVVIEKLFNVPGMGRLLLSAVDRRDYPIMQGINIFLAFFIVTANLLTDLTYGYLDPRIRYD